MLAVSRPVTMFRISLPPATWTWAARIGVAICWLMVAVSLAFPAFLVHWPKGTLSEYPSPGIFLFGWLGVMSVLDGKFTMIGWLANPLFFLTSIMLIRRRYRSAAVAGGWSLGFACTSVLLTSAIMNEAGHEAPIIAFAAGFHLWLTAICGQALLALGLCGVRREDAEAISQPDAAGEMRLAADH